MTTTTLTVVNINSKRQWDSEVGTGVLILRKMSIQMVSNTQIQYVSISRYYWQHYTLIEVNLSTECKWHFWDVRTKICTLTEAATGQLCNCVLIIVTGTWGLTSSITVLYVLLYVNACYI